MKLSTREKFIFAATAFILIGIAIVIVLFDTQSKLLAVGFFAWIGIGSFLLTQIRCPNCGAPVVYQGEVGRVAIYAGFVRHNCQKCGIDLTTRTYKD